MNSVLISQNEKINDDIYRLNEEKSLHLKKTLKVKIGDILKCTLLNKSLGKCKVVEISNHISVELIKSYPGRTFPIHLIVGASRPPTMKKILEHGTSLGVSHFHIVHTELGEKSYLQSKLYQNTEYQDLLELGLSQSANFYKVPTVSTYENISDIQIDAKQSFILSPYCEDLISHQEFSLTQEVVFALGSERGWTATELEKFKIKGFKEAKLSPSILRVEIATFALLGIVNQRMLLS